MKSGDGKMRRLLEALHELSPISGMDVRRHYFDGVRSDELTLHFKKPLPHQDTINGHLIRRGFKVNLRGGATRGRDNYSLTFSHDKRAYTVNRFKEKLLGGTSFAITPGEEAGLAKLVTKLGKKPKK